MKIRKGDCVTDFKGQRRKIKEKKRGRPASGGGWRDRRQARIDRRLEQRSFSEAMTRVACKREPNQKRESSKVESDRSTRDCAGAAVRGRRACGLRLAHVHERGQRTAGA